MLDHQEFLIQVLRATDPKYEPWGASSFAESVKPKKLKVATNDAANLRKMVIKALENQVAGYLPIAKNKGRRK